MWPANLGSADLAAYLATQGMAGAGLFLLPDDLDESWDAVDLFCEDEDPMSGAICTRPKGHDHRDDHRDESDWTISISWPHVPDLVAP